MTDALARLFSRCVEQGDCWVWTGCADRYGRITVNGQQWWTHRLSYTLLVADIPDAQQIDHLCRNRLCIRPDHLEAVPQQVNLARGIGPWAANKRKTHCMRGHEFTPENTYPQGRDGTARGCRTCKNDRRRAKAAAFLGVPLSVLLGEADRTDAA